MAVLTIRTWGDPVLRTPARPVERVGDVHRRLIADMVDTMHDAPGVGLAGPQVGVSERIFVFDAEGTAGALADPVIEWRSDDTVVDEEGCLSIPGLLYPVARHEAVTVAGLDETGERVTIPAEGLLARVFQHEIDHLDGVLFLDRLTPDDRRHALAVLRAQALGMPVPPSSEPAL